MSEIARMSEMIRPIIPATMAEIRELAADVMASGLAPNDLNTVPKLTVVILTGLELGLKPMFAIQKIALINGRPAIWGDAVPAILWARGFKLREWIEGEGDNAVAHCEVTRPGGDKIERIFSVHMARKAGLWSPNPTVRRRNKATGEWFEGKNDSPWHRYDLRMLAMRARGFAARDGAPDALAGLYLAEELQDDTDGDAQDAGQIKPAQQVKLEPDNLPTQPAKPVTYAGDGSDGVVTITKPKPETVPVERPATAKVATKAKAPAVKPQEQVELEPEPEAIQPSTALDMPEPGEAPPPAFSRAEDDDLTRLTKLIKAALSRSQLLDLKRGYPDADWEELIEIFDAKWEALP